jgi:hypothetical protein
MQLYVVPEWKNTTDTEVLKVRFSASEGSIYIRCHQLRFASIYNASPGKSDSRTISIYMLNMCTAIPQAKLPLKVVVVG